MNECPSDRGQNMIDRERIRPALQDWIVVSSVCLLPLLFVTILCNHGMILELQPRPLGLRHKAKRFGNNVTIASQCQYVMFQQHETKLFVLMRSDRHEEEAVRKSRF